MEKLKENERLNNIIKLLFIIASIMFAVPSIIYLLQKGTVLDFTNEFKFLLNDEDTLKQTLIYALILISMTILYFLIIKRREKIFKNSKRMFIFIAIIAIIFIVVVPFTSSDIFYYLGIGRINSTYSQNPYYTTIMDFVEDGDNAKFLENDTVLLKGYKNFWADTTVVYGPVWTLICKLVASLSFGSIDIGLLVFKMLNVLAHMLCCYLIYKITKKKIFVLLYGLNPFIMIEAIANVHNDIFIVLLTLLSLYFLVKKKNLLLSVLCLSLATGIKYLTIILLPFVIIYYFRNEKPWVRFIKCIEYGLIFLAFLILPYLLYVRDFHVLKGLLTQQEKVTKNFYVIICKYLTKPEGLVEIISKTLLGAFAIIYFFVCVTLLNKRKISFRKEIQKAQYFLIAFLFLIITNFQPWYIMWLFPLMIWQKSNIVKLVIQISLISQFANTILLIYSEAWENGVPFAFAMMVGIFVAIYLNNNKKFKKLYNTKNIARA